MTAPMPHQSKPRSGGFRAIGWEVPWLDGGWVGQGDGGDMAKTIAALLVSAALSGCCHPMPYQAFGASYCKGGYTNAKKAPGVYRVTFVGNGFTSDAQLVRYAWKRGKELCEAEDFPHALLATPRDPATGQKIRVQIPICMITRPSSPRRAIASVSAWPRVEADHDERDARRSLPTGR